jgi:hypothetical protein
MTSHCSIHMCSIPCQSHMHTNMSSIKIIQNQLSSPYNHMPYMLMLVILCHFHCEASSAVVRPHSITIDSHHPVSVIHEANTTVGRPRLITTGVVTLFDIIREANSTVVRPNSITTRVKSRFRYAWASSTVVRSYSITTGSRTLFMFHCSCHAHDHVNPP